MTHRSLRRLSPVLLAAVIAVGVGQAAPASAAPTGRVVASPSLNIRSDASTSAKVVGSIPFNKSVGIQCTKRGSTVNGNWGRTNLWDKVSYGGRTGYVSDGWLYTGSSGPVAGSCTVKPPAPSSSLSTKVDSFVNKWNGRYADYDGYYGAQCVDLFNFYSRDVVKARFAAVSYAYQLYDVYDSGRYTRLPANAAPRKGDVAIWSSSFPGSRRAGHVAIVLSSSGSKLTTLSQNPGATAKKTFTKSYLRGYLRPKA